MYQTNSDPSTLIESVTRDISRGVCSTCNRSDVFEFAEDLWPPDHTACDSSFFGNDMVCIDARIDSIFPIDPDPSYKYMCFVLSNLPDIGGIFCGHTNEW